MGKGLENGRSGIEMVNVTKVNGKTGRDAKRWDE